MRIALIIAALWCAGAAAAQAQIPDPTVDSDDIAYAPVRGAVRSGPMGAQRAAMGVNKCMDSNQGLPEPTDTSGRAVIIWPCHGGPNQNVRLNDGVLWIGPGRHAYIAPMPRPAADACDTYTWSSARRRYELGLCAIPGAPAAINTDRAVADLMPMVGVTTASAEGPSLGAPLRAVPVQDGHEPEAIWEHDRRTGQLRISGTDLCITPPSQDLSDGAPLILDSCEAPLQLDASDAQDGPQRSRVFLERVWRRIGG